MTTAQDMHTAIEPHAHHDVYLWIPTTHYHEVTFDGSTHEDFYFQVKEQASGDDFIEQPYFFCDTCKGRIGNATLSEIDWRAG